MCRVFRDNAFSDSQAQTGTGDFGREKRIENLFFGVFGNAHAGVSHFNLDDLPAVFCLFKRVAKRRVPPSGIACAPLRMVLRKACKSRRRSNSTIGKSGARSCFDFDVRAARKSASASKSACSTISLTLFGSNCSGAAAPYRANRSTILPDARLR